MDTKKNLVPQNMRTKEERSRVASMGGKASGEARKKKKAMRELAEAFGALPIDVSLPGGKRKKTTFDGAVIFAQYQKAIKEGNTKSAYFLAQLKGEMEQNVNVTSDQPIIVVNSQDEKEKLENIGNLDI